MRSKFLTSLCWLILSISSPLLLKSSSADTLQLHDWLEKTYQLYYSDPSLAMLICDSLIEESESKGLDLWQGKGLSRKAVVFWSQGKPDSSIIYEDQALTIFSDLHSERDIAKSQNNIGLYSFELLDFETSLKSYMSALEYFERNQDLNLMSNVYNNMANIHNRLRHYEIARDYYLKAVQTFEKTENLGGVAMVYANVGLIQRDLNREDSALWYFERAGERFQITGNQLNEAKVLINTGTSRIKLGDTLGGKADFERSLALARELGNPAEMGTSYMKLAHVSLMLHQSREAIRQAKMGMELLDSANYVIAMETLNRILSLSYEDVGRVDSALIHLKAAYEARDTIYNREKTKAIAELQIQYQTKLKESKIEILEVKNEVATLRTFWLITLAIALLLSTVLIYLRQRAIVARETRLKEQEYKMRMTEKALAEAEIRNADSEKKRLTTELEYKGKELSNLALHIVQKNELLEKLNEEIRGLRGGSNAAESQKLKNLSLFTNQMLSLEKDREEFQIFIQEANQNFFSSLEDSFPNLTPRDRRLCAMIKLGYSSKEISSILNIETSSVEVSRYRLRKKLGIEKSINLQEFLNSVA